MTANELIAILSTLPPGSSHVIVKGRATPDVYASVPFTELFPADSWEVAAQTKGHYPEYTTRAHYIG